MSTTTIKVDDKYTVCHEHGTNLRTLRYGQPWREHIGDGLILAMAQRIEELESELEAMTITANLERRIKAAEALLA